MVGLDPSVDTATSRPTTAQTRRSSRRLLAYLREVASTVIPLAVLVLIWQLVAADVVANPFKMPTPARVWDGAQRLWQTGQLAPAVETTVERILLAYVIALVAGVAVGIAIGRVQIISAALRPVVAFFLTLPKTAVYPALVLVLGLGTTSKVVFAVLLATFQVMIATAAAASAIDDKLVWAAQSLGLPRSRVFTRIVLPSTLPGAMAGARVGLIGAVIGVFVGEMMVGDDGLGQLMMRSNSALDTSGVYSCLVVVCLLAVVLDAIVLGLGRKVTWWSEDEH